jgi:arabinogalactan oligomer/maltooligosaccharide transport system permease protein
MSALKAQVGDSSGSPTSSGRSFVGAILRYIGLFIVNAFALLLVYRLAADQVYTLAAAIAIITIFVNVVNIRAEFYPLRWMSPGLALMGLMVIYPILFTLYVAFTNYGDGHLYTIPQAVEILERRQYLPEGEELYSWELYKSDADEYAIWMIVDETSGIFAYGDTLEDVTVNESGEGPYDDVGLPTSINGFERVTERRDLGPALLVLQGATFGPEEDRVLITSASTRNRQAGASRPLYTFDAEQNAVVNNETGVVYFADMEIGNFISDQLDEEGNPLTLDVGFWVSIGFENFDRFLTSPAISGPLLQIFVWTVVFAIISVLSTFALGLFYALLLNAKVPGHRIFRTLLIVPYAIPGIIAVAIWKGMLNPNFGVLSALITQVFGSSPEFFADPNWAKFGILFINLWLGYPYFLLVCSGALAAIPSDMYEAAKVDGANFLQQFRFLTLPMLLVAVGPLLVASFTYNFNNFVIIEVYNEGGPPIPGAATPAGYTDILISYTYRLAFGGGRGADYGLASAITIIIFLMVAAVTLLQFRFTRQLEEVSENV